MTYSINRCEYNGFGIIQKENGVYLCQAYDRSKSCGIMIYNNRLKELESIYFDTSMATGNVICIFIQGLSLVNKYYRLISGDRTYPDKYCRNMYGLKEFGQPATEDDIYCAVSNFDTKLLIDDRVLKHAYSDSCFYTCHVRGISMLDDSIDIKRGTFAALTKKSSYFKELGITGLILMPVYERIENKLLKTELSNYEGKLCDKVNYWGFGPGFYYSLKQSFSATDNPQNEFIKLVRTLHDNDIEIILTFDFNHNNYSFVSDVLRYWINNYHIDGFRLFGVDDIYSLINDPFFKDTKLILENYKDIPYESEGSFKNIAVFDDDYLTLARSFLKSDENCVGRMSYYIRENHNNYAVLRNMTDFDGFTLMDLVSYETKHNEANGENNLDGASYNYSWNCGEEGPADDKSVNKLRIKQIKNALILTLLCQGTPVIREGDEILNSQNGNNNTYCQDNETGWVNWKQNAVNKEIKQFIKNLLYFRKNHVILHQPYELKLFDYLSCKLPDVSFHGEEERRLDYSYESRAFSALYSGAYSKQYSGKEEESVLIMYNMHWDDKNMAIPKIDGKDWYILAKTDVKCDFSEEKAKKVKGSKIKIKRRSIAILITK